MPRRVQDILPADHRSIRNVPLGVDEPAAFKNTKDKGDKVKIHRITNSSSKRIPVTPPAPMERELPEKRLRWVFLTLGIIVIIAGIGYVASSYYSKASFTIEPKVLPVIVNGTYIAQANPGNNVLVYSLVTLKATASTTVPAIDGPIVSTKAQGFVTLYNSYSAQAVRLIAGTRLTNEAGKIYRLSSSVLIPGYKKPGTNIIPGNIKATIIADMAGQSYNISKNDSVSDFKVVAYNGSAKYGTIYARLISEISGGMSGTKKTVSPNTLASTTAVLRSQITTNLSTDLASSVPEGYIMYDTARISSFKDPIISGGQSKSAIVTVSGTLSGFLFKKSELIAKLSGNQAVSSFGTFGYDTPGLETISFFITNLKDYSIEKKGSLIIKAKGDLKLVGIVPVDEIRNKLLGHSIYDSTELFRTYSDVIKTSKGELIPQWAKIPTDPKRVSIKVEIP